MWNKSLLRASEPAAEVDALSSLPPSEGEAASGLELAQLASALASHTDAAIAADLALDLVLNEIVEEARLGTSATGAAIGLIQDDEMICRATSGKGPGLGVRLNMQSGMFGTCVQERQPQIWQDDEADAGPEADGYRAVGIRSLALCPVMRDERSLGILGVFSTVSNAFSNGEMQTLQVLSRRIVENVEQAGKNETTAAPAPPEQASTTEAVSDSQAGMHETDIEPEAEAAISGSYLHDYYTDALTVIVVGLALLLGWMVGRAGWRQAKSVRHSAAVTRKAEPAAPEPLSPPAADATAAPADVVPADKARPKPARKESENRSQAPAPGELIVYEKGKEIFRSEGVNSAGLRSPDDPTSNAASSGKKQYVPISSSTADAYLAQRIDPTYPQDSSARGRVVVEIFVDQDGTVQEVKPIKGDAQLLAAAAAALRQWKYRPYAPAGAPLNFRTRLTVDFKKP